jgi:hypothetical protein
VLRLLEQEQQAAAVHELQLREVQPHRGVICPQLIEACASSTGRAAERAGARRGWVRRRRSG